MAGSSLRCYSGPRRTPFDEAAYGTSALGPGWAGGVTLATGHTRRVGIAVLETPARSRGCQRERDPRCRVPSLGLGKRLTFGGSGSPDDELASEMHLAARALGELREGPRHTQSANRIARAAGV